ncbi:MAG: DUF72 domain-containing protein, partial [Acidobacteria bacterium]|nr:DUF72 domain-containing protein [Acidobacteriota bacterium]
VYIGTSGWNYKHWANGTFYPEGLKQADWLRFYCRHFDTVEINNTFYRLPEGKVFQKWREGTPEKFCFAVKVSRYFTHMEKLAQPERHLALFLRNASGLQKKLGVLLFQLPPFWGFNPERLDEALTYLRKQSLFPKARAALEVRHPSWNSEACFQILRKHKVSLVQADQPGFTNEGPVTADFVFARRHGPKDRYASNYTAAHLRKDAAKIRGWLAEGLDVYCYFNNDVHGYAVKNALSLKRLLSPNEKSRKKELPRSSSERSFS